MQPQGNLMMGLTVIEFRDLHRGKTRGPVCQRAGVEPFTVPVMETLLPRQRQQLMVQSVPSAWAQILQRSGA